MRIYTLSNIITSFTGPKTLVEIGALTDTLVKIRAIKVTQSTSESDDSSRLEWGVYSASGTGTNIVANVEPNDPGDAAFGGTAEDNHTADISTGEVIKGREGISVLAGVDKIYQPDSRLSIPGGSFFAVQLRDAISSVTLVYEIEFSEEG